MEKDKMTKNLFEIAAKNKYRYKTNKCLINSEDLYDLPLKTTRINDISLNLVAKNLFQEIKEEEEVSFVEPTTNRKRTTLENKLEIVKHVIKVKQDAIHAKEQRLADKENDAMIDQLIADKKTKSLSELSVEELQKLKSTNR